VHIEAGALERLITDAEAHGVDFCAVLPRMDPVNLAVDATVAVLGRILALAGRSWRANDDRSPVGVGVGAFNLARRSWLDRTEAISQLRMEVADDVALGAWLKHHGARTRLFAGRRDVHLVFMDSLGACARSADKGGGMLGFNPWLTLLFTMLPSTVELLVPVAALARGGIAGWLGGTALAVATATHILLCAHFSAPLRGALLWPLGEVINGWLTLRAGLHAWQKQGIAWRDTFYPRAALEAGRRLQMGTLRVIGAGSGAGSPPSGASVKVQPFGSRPR
jgi:Glycosyl transferase family 21